jgi:hypothetical protein
MKKRVKESLEIFGNGHLFLSIFHFMDGKFCKRWFKSIMQ